MARCAFAEEELWYFLWESGACERDIYSALYSGKGATLVPENLQRAREIMADTFRRYLASFPITEPGNKGYNPLQEHLYRACRDLPGICDLALESFCPDHTRKEIESSPALLSFCGCFAPPLEGKIREYLLTPDLKYNRPCDPLCSRVGTVKLPTPTGEKDLCTANVCVISDVTLKISKSALPYVSFGQVCPCKENCRCIFSSSDPSGLLRDLNLNYSLYQYCPAQATCLESLPDGTSRVVECTPAPPKVSVSNVFYVALFSVVFFLLVVGLLYSIFSGS